MRYPITHAQAQKLHPSEYAALEAQFSNVKCKSFQGKTFKDLSLCYEMSVFVKGGSFLDVLAGRQTYHESTVDEKIQDLHKNAHVCLVAYTGNLWRDVTLGHLPKSIEDKYRAEYDKEEAERKRFKALSPKEQEAETVKCLKQLAGPGFMAVNPTGMVGRAAKAAGVRILKTK